MYPEWLSHLICCAAQRLFCPLVAAQCVFGPTAVTADNCFSCLQKLYRSTWTKSICHVAWQWSRFNQMRPLALSVPGWKNSVEQKLDLSLWKSVQGAAVHLCECTRGNLKRRRKQTQENIFSVVKPKNNFLSSWVTSQMLLPAKSTAVRILTTKVNLHVPLSNVTNTEDDTFCALSLHNSISRIISITKYLVTFSNQPAKNHLQ